MISVGSLLGATTMAVLTLYYHGLDYYSGLALFAAVMIWWTHRQNIKRILNGTESKIGKKKAA
jgi:glycerol-3-phosphate acyltransferase PlsY